jgi:hypothetical protein
MACRIRTSPFVEVRQEMADRQAECFTERCGTLQFSGSNPEFCRGELGPFFKYACGGFMYIFFLPSLVGLIVIGCITLKDQFQFKVQQ